MTKMPQAFSFLRFHGPWMGVLLLALALALTAHAYGVKTEARLAAKTAHLTQQIKKNKAAKALLEEDARRTKELQASLSPDAMAQLLQPADRRAFLNHLDTLAHTARLQHLAYTLSPATFDALNATQSATLSLEADAPLDTDLRAFLDRLTHSAPGKLDWQRLQITRLDTRDGARPLNLHLVASALWLAPGVAPIKDEMP